MWNLKRLMLLSMALIAVPLAACNSTLGPALETTPGPEATVVAPTSAPPPDLGRLAYIQGGDVWVRELPDGEPRRLTDDGRNTAPQWSPSGRWLAFRKDVEVWVTDVEGNHAYPLDDRAPVTAFAWSPTEDRLAYLSGSGASWLKAINADGTAAVTLVPGDTAEPSGQIAWGRIAWSPDGQRVAYVWERTAPSGPGWDYVGIRSVEIHAGSEPAEHYALPGPPQDGLILAGWAPDGRSLLFWRVPSFSASAAADGLPLLWLPPDGGEPVEVAASTLLHPDFWNSSPTDRQVALTVGAGRETWTNKRIALLDLDTGALEYLTDETVSAFSPAFSPDGQQIAYVAAPDVGRVWGGDEARASAARRRIWVIGIDGSDRHPLTDDPSYRDERPLWSADGTYILFARLDGDGRASLWLMDVADGATRQVVNELTPAPEWFGYYGYIAWDDLFDWWRGPAQ